MEDDRLLRKRQFWAALALVVVIIVVAIGNYQRWWNLHFLVGPLYLHHWLGFIGAGYIAVFTPIYALTKRRSPERAGRLLQAHVFGNLAAFMLISIHLTQQMGRTGEFAPMLGTGLALYIIVGAMVVTGFMLRFQLARRFLKSWRFVHVSLSLSFYIILVIHILHNLGII